MSQDASLDLPSIIWEEGGLRRDGELWSPKIFHIESDDLSRGSYLARLKEALSTPSKELLEADGALIPFDLSIDSNLDWSEQIEILEELNRIGKKAYVFLDIGFSRDSFSIEDTATFMALGLGIDQLILKILEPYKEVIEAAFLSWQAKSFSSLIHWTPSLCQDFAEYLREKKAPEGDLSSIRTLPLSSNQRFCLELFSKELVVNFLNLLITQLPMDLAVGIHFSSSKAFDFESSSMRLLYLFERRSLGSAFFAWDWRDNYSTSSIYSGPYGELSTPEGNGDAAVGILIPELDAALISEEFYSNALKVLNSKKVPIRIIPSEVFHEEWHALDIAVGASNALSYEAFRQLVGFSVSGGIYAYLDQRSPHLEEDSQKSFFEVFKEILAIDSEATK